MKKLTKLEANVFNFLNELRNSGTTNMYGARPYIVDNFSIEKREAGKILALWINNFEENREWKQRDNVKE